MYAYEIDDEGFIVENYLVDGVTVIPEGCIETQLPQPLLFFRPKWIGEEWIEGATQEEIDELTKPQPHVPTDTEILGQQMTERELEGILQGQQITDMDIRVMMLEMGAN